MIIITFCVFILIIFNYLKNKMIKLPKPGENDWALITGCTDGIGLSFTKELSGRGFNIIMISKNINKLESLRSEIETTFKNKTLLFMHDFSKKSDNFYFNLSDVIKNLNIKVVVNNVGIAYEYPKYFKDNSMDFYNDIIECNVNSILKITYVISKYCYSYDEITFINISSVLSDIPIPYFTIYSATKSFVNAFTKYLSLEFLHNTDMKFYCIKPWYVSTKLMKKKVSFFCPNPDVYVQSLLKYGYFIPHVILDICSLILYVPFLGDKLLFKISQRLLNIRNTKLKKVT